MRKRVLLSVLVVALAAFIAVGSAGAGSPPNRPGKAVSAPTAKTLELDAMLVYHAALCLAAPQLSAQHMKDNSAYDSNLVASLGGTVLPPCA